MIDKNEFCKKLIEIVDDVCCIKATPYSKRSYSINDVYIEHDYFKGQISIVDGGVASDDFNYMRSWNYTSGQKCYEYNLPREEFCRSLCGYIHALKLNVPYEYGALKKLIEIVQEQDIGF